MLIPKQDRRKIVIGLIFGSLNSIYYLVIGFLFIGVFKFPDNFSLPGIFNTVILTGLPPGLIGGVLSLFLLGYKSKIKSFYVGFFIGLVIHSIVPILFEFLYATKEITIPISGYYLSLIIPFILGVIFTYLFIQKEDFIPSRKPILIIGILCLLSYIFMHSHLINFSTSVEVIEEPADTLTNEEIEIPAQDEGILLQLATNFGVKPEEVRVEYKKTPADFQNKFASGIVFSANFDNGQSGQNFIAAKEYGRWVTIVLGTGIIPLCSEIEVYNFPLELLSSCLDQNGKLVQRN